MEADRSGARQPVRFDPRQAARLDDPARFAYLPPAGLFFLLDAPQDAVVIDFGTGTGAYAIRLAKARPDLTVIALDEQPRMLRLLQAKLAAGSAPNVRPFRADNRGLAALRACAARILALNVLHELGDDAVKRIAALLTARGRVLFVDWNGAVERPVGPPRQHVYTPAGAVGRLKRLGFKILRKRIFRYHYALVCGAGREVRAASALPLRSSSSRRPSPRTS
jgi:SAM-dependent methyltransferase